MKKLLFILIILRCLFSFSQKIDFKKSILVIPDSLTQNANVIIRNNKTNVIIQSKRSMVVKYKKLITVLNENGNGAFFIKSYNKYTNISNILIRIYDKFGKRIKKVKTKEINDVAAVVDLHTLFSDYRYKYYKYIPNQYPYTIEISYEVNTSNTAFIPKWKVYDNYFSSVVSNSYSITYPKDLILNYKEINFKNYNIIKKIIDNTITYKVENLKALKKEPYSPILSNITPNVFFGLNTFSLAGEIGDASSWENFGKWMNQKLLKDRNEIPESTKTDIKNLVKGIENPIKRARLVYQYMQDKTRYISVQIGIGGWKPMLAKDVDRLKYGDCKALSYYTKSLLDQANIKSAYTIVWSGNKKTLIKTWFLYKVIMLCLWFQ